MWQTIFQKKILIFLGIAFLFITWAIFITSNPERTGEIAPEWLTRFVIYPIQQGFGAVTKATVDSWHTLNTIGRVNRDNQDLRTRLERIRMENDRLRHLAEENARFRKDLDFKQQSPLNLLPAEVIAQSPSHFTRTITIDKGSRNGVRRNMAVITAEGVAGRVLIVHPTSSEILLLNDGRDGNSLTGVLERTRDLVYVYGAGEYCLVVPSDIGVTLRNGDRILTSESSLFFPKDLFVGVIVDVKRSGAGLKGEALMKPAIAVSRLEEVFVIMNSKSEPPKEVSPTTPADDQPKRGNP